MRAVSWKMRLGWVAVVVGLFAAITMIALEGGEVVIVRTLDPKGAIRETRTWIAEHEGALWIEAASPSRGFYLDLRREPTLELAGAGRAGRYSVIAYGDRDGHQLIRHLLRERYGWKDWWIGLLANTEQSIAVRLQPVG